MTTPRTGVALLQALHGSCDGVTEFRTFRPGDSGPPSGRAFLKSDDVNSLTFFIGSHLREHAYFGVATRRDGSSGTLENCARLPALFVDLDFKHTPEPVARQRLAECPFTPSAVVRSGNGLHAYWLLKEPLDLQDQAERGQAGTSLRRLAHYLDADLQAAEPARVLRLPGTQNFKYDPPRDVVVDLLEPERRYNVSEFDDLLPPEPVEANRTPFVAPEKICDSARNTTLYREARSMKAKHFSREAIRDALHAENRVKCEPSLPDPEVEDIVESAWSQPDRAAFTQTSRAGYPHDDTPAEAAAPGMESPVAFQLVTAPDSFVTKYIQYAAMRTDAPLEAHEALAFGILSALAFGILSALAGPSVTLPIATAVKGWRLTLWLLYLVNSTVGRKSTTLDLAVDVVRAVLGESALIHWEGSPQGLLQRLQTRDGEASVFVRDEYSGLMASMNRGGHLAGLPQLLIKGFDGSVLENVRTRKRGPDGDTHSDTDRVEQPYLVQFAAAPWDAFTERATIDNVLDGFLARFLIVMGSASERGLPMITEEIRAAGIAVYDQARTYAQRVHTIQQTVIEPGVLARQWRLEQAYRQRTEASARPDAAGPSLKRLAETALKLSALLAIEEETGTILSIREEHFLVAAQITDKWAGNALRLVEALGRTTFQRDCQAVLRTIQQRPAGIPKGQLYRLHQRLRQRDFEEILSALETQERITIEKAEATGRGRPAFIVRALKEADQ